MINRLLFFIIPMTILLCSCGESSNKNETTDAASVAPAEKNAQPDASKTNSESETSTEPDQNSTFKKLLGIYVGDFKAVTINEISKASLVNRINITLESFANGKVKGHSVVAGNSRPFEGVYELKQDSIYIDVKEPGDDKYDGSFVFRSHINGKSIIGEWIANNQKLRVPKREFELEKTTFSYDSELKVPVIHGYILYSKENAPDYNEYVHDGEFLTEGISLNASDHKLEPKEVENLFKGDLEVIRNAIYARHGYSFKTRRMRYFFDRHVDWYTPMYTDVRESLTDIEIKNIDLIKRYENHADIYYDSFGR